jgi:hypothetical protein
MNEFVIKNGFVSKDSSQIQGALTATTYYGDGSNLTGLGTTTGTFGVSLDGLGSVITTGSAGFITIPFNCIISDWYLAGNVSGSIVFSLTRGITSIVGGGNKPTLSSQQSSSSPIIGWNVTTLSTGDLVEFNVDSCSVLTRVNLVIKVTKL